MAGVQPQGSYGAAIRRTISQESRPIEYVQIDGLVVLKIIKHVQEETSGSSNPDVTGILLGMVQNQVLEVTNCFGFPRNNDDGEEMDEADYQHIMVRYMRNANVDHLHVGWYQSSPYGVSNGKLETVDSQYTYQNNIEESVVLIYDPVRTQKGFLSLKAYRLSNLAMKLCKEGDFTPDTLRQNKMCFDKFFEEVPIKVRNSHLINTLMCSMDIEMASDEGKQFLDLGNTSVLEKTLQQQIKSIEEVSKMANHQRQITIKQQHIAKENALRKNRDEPPMTEDEINKIIKPIPALQRLESLLNYCQTLNFCQQSSSFAAQNMGKLFMSKALHIPKDK